MDALLFKGEWQKKTGSFELVDEIKAVALEIAPDWPQHTITRTNWSGPNSRFVTPYENPVCCYSSEKKPVFKIGKEIEGCDGIFELSYCEGVKAVIGSRSAPIPKDPSRKLFYLDGFEKVAPPAPTAASEESPKSASQSVDKKKTKAAGSKSKKKTKTASSKGGDE